jgi:hypothetical protein
VDRETLAGLLPYAACRDADGQFLAAHDQRMRQQFVNHPQDADLWDCVPGIACRILLLRGGRSDHAPLPATEAEFAIVEELIERGP